METLLLVLLVVIVIALVVWKLPRLRAQAAGRRRGSRMRQTAPAADQMNAAAHVPDDDEVRMRAQAHREAATEHRREATAIEDGAGSAAPPAARPGSYDERY
jgi:hypothetical protein